MAKERDEATLADAVLALAQSVGASQQQLAEAIEALRGSQPPRDVNFGDVDYQERLRAETAVFPRPVYQNGFEANPSGLSVETLQRIGELVPGKYLGGFVTIVETPQNGIDFRYRNMTADHRMIQQKKFDSFTELVEKCWAERHATAAA